MGLMQNLYSVSVFFFFSEATLLFIIHLLASQKTFIDNQQLMLCFISNG